MKRPSFQFYPGDWQRDAALRSCSLGARGLWMEMMCIAHQGDPYGHVALNGAAVTVEQLSRMVGAKPREVARWLAELEAAGVFSRDAEGRIFSRRMARDEALRTRRAEIGREFGHLGAEHGWKGGRPPKEASGSKPPEGVSEGVSENPQTTPPSSSSSSSSSKLGGNGKRQGPNGKSRGTPCPEEFEVSDDMAGWAVEQGVNPDALKPQTEKFLDHHRAKGTTFRDWNAAWRTWMRNSVEFAARRH